jgi:energy-coupling factor transporter ATP-binding protein EcfA2
MLQNRPLYDNRADGRYFVHPEQWDPLIKSIERGLNVLLSGPRGSGKTTLLRQIQMKLREGGETVVFADATAASDVFELLSRIRSAFPGGEPSPLVSGMQYAIGALGPRESPVAGASRAVAVQLDAIASEEPTTILLDASAAAEAVYDLFGRLRDQLWQQPHRWVVAIGENEVATVMRPPADAFFDQAPTLEDWSVNGLAEMLHRRARDEEDAIPALVSSAAAAGEGNPRKAVRALGDAVVSGRSPGDRLYERGRLLERASDIGRAPGMLMAELLDREQASPSDEDLQATLGVSRARLTQMFRQLQNADLVVAGVARPDGPGRPRTVYRPALRK